MNPHRVTHQTSRRVFTRVSFLGVVLALAFLRHATTAHAFSLTTQPAASSKPVQVFIITAADAPKAPLVGRWEATFPGEARSFTVNLAADHGKLSGAFTMGPESAAIFDGRIEGNTITFSVKSPTGNRTVTFVGTANGNELAFTRSVKTPPDGLPGGAGIFGANGVPKFTATRAK